MIANERETLIITPASTPPSIANRVFSRADQD
jgi:hypothetical protein